MDLRPSADQRAFQDAVRELVHHESTPERVRAAEASGFDAGLWSHLTRMGAVGVAVDEELVGAESAVSEVVSVAQGPGRRVRLGLPRSRAAVVSSGRASE